MRTARIASPQAPVSDDNSAVDAGMRQLMVTIASELAVITGALYYFGWVRTRVQAERMGFPSSVLNLSVADHVLKSVNVLFPLIVTILLLTIAGHIAWVAVISKLSVVRSARGRPRGLLGAVRILIFICLLGGVLGSMHPANNRFVLPLGLTAAVIFALAARALKRRLDGLDPWSRPRRWMATLLLIFLIFWDVERVALFFGEEFAADYKARPGQFSAITLYSKDDLSIEAVNVKTEKRGDEDGSYRYKYTGLRLMESSADRYILINEDWSNGRGRVFVILQSDAIRIEFDSRS